MTFLPIVGRELRIAARRTATYRNRVIIAGVVAVAAMMMLVFGIFSNMPSQIGRSTFWTLAYFALAFCLFEGIRKTSDCLSEEKREGTLGLLFLTDLKGYDVVLGKLAGMSLNSFYGLVAILPILALPMLLGGVLPGEFWRVVLALADILFFSLSAGMLASAMSRQERRARAFTSLVIAIIAAVPLLTFRHSLFPFSPIHAFTAASARVYPLMPSHYWHSLEIALAMSWLLLILASVIAPHSWQEEKTIAPSSFTFPVQAARRNDPYQSARRAQMLDINPAYWLAGRNAGQRFILALGIALAVGGAGLFIFASNFGALPPYLALFIVLNLVLKMRIAAQACHCLAEARRNNALEMLLSTPLTVEQIIHGQLLALKKMFLRPVLVILGFELAGYLGGQMTAYKFGNSYNPHGFGDFLFGYGLSAVGIMAYLILFTLDIFAVVWAGMWFGLSSKKESQAVTKTIFFALILPLLTGMFFCYGFPFIIGIPIFMIGWAGNKLRREFRRVATQQYRPQKDPGWIPGVP